MFEPAQGMSGGASRQSPHKNKGNVGRGIRNVSEDERERLKRVPLKVGGLPPKENSFIYYVCIIIVYMIVFDASTLILLAKIELLGDITKEINAAAPETVKEEVTAKDTFDSKLIRSLIKKDNIAIQTVKESPLVEELMKDFNMDRGEASVVVLSKELEADLIATDDGQLIKAAKIMDIPFVTSITFLIRANEKSVLEEDIALEKLKRLEEFGWYKPRILEDAEEKIKGGKE